MNKMVKIVLTTMMCSTFLIVQSEGVLASESNLNGQSDELKNLETP